VHLDGERAIWVSDDGRWHWDEKAQAWTRRPTGRGNQPEPDDPPRDEPSPDDPRDEPSPDEPLPGEALSDEPLPGEALSDEPTPDESPADDEPVGLDTGLGLDRMWSPPGRPARRKLRLAWSGERMGRRTRLVLAGAAAVVLSGAALAVLLPDGDGGTDGAPPAPAHAYSTEAQESYLKQCRANPAGSDQLCGCSLDRFQARYSQEDFVALQARFAAKDPTAVQQFTAIAAACLPH
jgi:hypothetical protein